MGTRADFYVGRGVEAEWLGSIAWDGDEVDDAILAALSPDAYRQAVANFLAARDDATLPVMGWPWPWDDSRTTDYAYAFETGGVLASKFGHAWFDPKAGQTENAPKGKVAIFPDLSSRRNLTMGSRSGIMLIGQSGSIPTSVIDDQEWGSPTP